jgi:xylulokinase
LQGAIFGLNLRHSPGDIARAYLEGVFYEVRRCVDVLAETLPVESVRVSGNIVHSPSSTQMLADILDRVVVSVPERSPAAIGAALLARRICDGAAAHGPRPSLSARTTPPNRPAAQQYASLYREYVERAARCE